ncbi:hypothetical protein V6N13_133908 [Hibiscus sabdariffa]
MHDMIYEVLKLDNASIWVKAWHVPLELYSQKGIDYISSAIGKPMDTNKAIVMKHQLEFTKICVEEDAKYKLPRTILVELEEGSGVYDSLELAWLPPRDETIIDSIVV